MTGSPGPVRPGEELVPNGRTWRRNNAQPDLQTGSSRGSDGPGDQRLLRVTDQGTLCGAVRGRNQRRVSGSVGSCFSGSLRCRNRRRVRGPVDRCERRPDDCRDGRLDDANLRSRDDRGQRGRDDGRFGRRRLALLRRQRAPQTGRRPRSRSSWSGFRRRSSPASTLPRTRAITPMRASRSTSCPAARTFAASSRSRRVRRPSASTRCSASIRRATPVCRW